MMYCITSSASAPFLDLVEFNRMFKDAHVSRAKALCVHGKGVFDTCLTCERGFSTDGRIYARLRYFPTAVTISDGGEWVYYTKAVGVLFPGERQDLENIVAEVCDADRHVKEGSITREKFYRIRDLMRIRELIES